MLVYNEAEIRRLLLEVAPHISTDWRQDNGELYLVGECLTQCGLTGQPLATSVMPGKVVIQILQG